jgi:hypothetical protein
MAEKPRGKPPADKDRKESGRLGEDDRGNISWQWAEDNEDLLADDELGKLERMRALQDPHLELADEPDKPNAPAKANPRGLKDGYNPYNSGQLGKAEWKKKRDLRQLSEWIELKKKMEKKDSE